MGEPRVRVCERMHPQRSQGRGQRDKRGNTIGWMILDDRFVAFVSIDDA
jgi:hypothetical protein